jgi:hypothetical protein
MIGLIVRAPWWLVLALASCATTALPREMVLPRVPPDRLSEAFPACGIASVVASSDTDYRVFACYQVATYHCDAARQAGCTLEAIDPVVAPADSPTLPPPPPPPAPGRKKQADQWFDDARARAKESPDAEACRLFTESYAIMRTFGTSVNLGDCALRAGHPGLAFRYYAEALQYADDPAKTKFAHDRIATLAPQLCTLVVTFDDPDAEGLDLQIGGHDVPPEPELRQMVDPAEVPAVEVVVTQPGVYVRRWIVTSERGATKPIHVPPLTAKK